MMVQLKMKVIRKSITEISESEKTQIDNFIEKNDGLIFHETRFNEIASLCFNTSLFYFLALQEEKLIGICPVHAIRKKNVFNSFSNLTQFEIPYGGWVYEKTSINSKLLYKKTKPKFNENLTIFSSFLHSADLDNFSNKTLQTALIDLEFDESYILSTIISSNTRHNIRRASKKGVSIIEITDITIFIKLYNTLKGVINKEIKDENEKFLEQLFSEFNKKNKAFIIGAVFREEIISAVLCIGNCNIYHAYIAGRIAVLPRNIYQNERIWWDCILRAKHLGANSFDLCVIEPERLPNIAQFKMGFTKELIPFYCMSKKSFLFRVINKIQNVFTN